MGEFKSIEVHSIRIGYMIYEFEHVHHRTRGIRPRSFKTDADDRSRKIILSLCTRTHDSCVSVIKVQ